MKRPLDTLMQKEMDRKEFLVTAGFGIAALLGLSTILQFLGKSNEVATAQKSDSGYGAASFGKER